jgi:hypothetical protein
VALEYEIGSFLDDRGCGHAASSSAAVLAVFAVVAMAASLAFKRTGFTRLHKT